MEIVGGPERITAKSSIGGRGRAGRDAAVRHRVLTAIDLFAGAGGFSLGLRRAGFDVVLANEYSIDAEWTYRHNILGDTPEGVFPKRPDDHRRARARRTGPRFDSKCSRTGKRSLRTSSATCVVAMSARCYQTRGCGRG